jgi:hypothetical protein
MHVVQKNLEEVECLFYRLDYFNCLTIHFCDSGQTNYTDLQKRNVKGTKSFTIKWVPR